MNRRSKSPEFANVDSRSIKSVRRHGLGEYSNRMSDHEGEQAALRNEFIHEVGEYVLTLHPKWMAYEVSRKDGSSVPAGLAGKWTDVDSFRAALGKHDASGAKSDVG